jgi:predicted RNA-binding Zn-ribbon protein involved in translation (DUF1610 family)
MAKKYRCPKCADDPEKPPEQQTEVVLCHSGGVKRTMICTDCNRELQYVEDVETKFVGQKEDVAGDDYHRLK